MIRKSIRRLKDLIRAIRLFRNWHIAIMELLYVAPPQKMRYVLRNGLVFNARANTSDTFTIIECFRKHVYDKHKQIGSKDTIIDIGANIGSFSIYAAGIARQGTVYSFEPETENFHLLEENTKENKIFNLKLFELGVAGGKDQAKLFLSKSPGHHSMCLTKRACGKSSIVKVDSLKNIFTDNKIECCDFLKIDCEGAEFDILFNCPQAILKKIKYIAMEFHEFDKRYNHLQLTQFLSNNGFHILVSDKNRDYQTGMLYASRNRQ